jgi:hypothetical protein
VGDKETRRLGKDPVQQEISLDHSRRPPFGDQIWSPSLLDALETVLSQDQIHDGGK